MYDPSRDPGPYKGEKSGRIVEGKSFSILLMLQSHVVVCGGKNGKRM